MTKETLIKNAHLADAAPDLFMALEVLLFWYETSVGKNTTDELARENIDLATRALQKARGES